MQRSIYIRHLESGQEWGVNEDVIMEGSSTIKVAIVLLTLHKLKTDKISPLTRLPILPQHLSIGSGKLNWMRKRSLSIRAYISYIARYSDCVASNVLIDFLGGQKTINQQLADMGFMSTLDMAPLNFTDKEAGMPKVSTTTARELAGLFEQMFQACDKPTYQWLIRKSFSHIYQPWYGDGLDFKGLGPKKLWTKTGSMIEVGPKHDTVLNIAGVVELGSGMYVFSGLNRMLLGERSTPNDLEQAKEMAIEELMKTFSNAVR